MSVKDFLEIKTGEFLAKSEDLKEANVSLRLSNEKIKVKVEQLKKTKRHLTEIEKNLVIANTDLSEANDKLTIINDEMLKVTSDLTKANEEIKQQSLRQKEFIDITAHELRTPTQSILGYSELILSEQSTNIEYIKVIARNANRIEKLVSNILDMARIDNFNLELTKEQFNLSSLISTIVKDFRNQIKYSNKKNLDLIYDNSTILRFNLNQENNNNDVFIKADRDRIAQVIINLVDNAIKNTDSGKITIITTTTDPTHIKENGNPNYEKDVIIKVRDSGTGLDSNLFSKVFSKFFTTSGRSGTGLGLFISKAIVEAHDGSIWVENNNGERGTTFSFTIPT